MEQNTIHRAVETPYVLINPIRSRSYLAFSVLFSRLGSPRHWQGSRGFSVVVVVVVVLVVVGAGVGAAPVSVALLPTWIIGILQKPKDYTNLIASKTYICLVGDSCSA